MITVECPRCRLEGRSTIVERDFYGLCDECRAQLRTKFQANARPVEVESYQPSSNVVENHVAAPRED